MGDDDLPMLHRWLNEPGVVRWWEGDDVSWEAVVRDYGPASTDPTEHWLASVDGRDIGWIQCYAAPVHLGEGILLAAANSNSNHEGGVTCSPGARTTWSAVVGGPVERHDRLIVPMTVGHPSPPSVSRPRWDAAGVWGNEMLCLNAIETPRVRPGPPS